ncbi:MAG: TIGR03790 family protein [Armatimonadetes bacterium]|nr:TIGR03790 family protein [Armatimonadota bacterium]
MNVVTYRAARVVCAHLVLLTLTFLTFLCAASPVCGGGGPKSVLVVQNTRSRVSADIAAYYVRMRGIPKSNLCAITCSTNEIVSKQECETKIVAPIREFLKKPEIADRIHYIVLTKGVPLGADYGYKSGPLSVTSILTCVAANVTEPITNPYGPTAQQPVEAAFSYDIPLGARLYLVTRLDAYTVEDVHRMINRSIFAVPFGHVALDRRVVDESNTGYVALNDRLATANYALESMGVPTTYDDSHLFLGWMQNLIGYFSWGSNDPSFTFPAYTSNSFQPGSIADTYVSTSGRTFDRPAESGQSLIADLIPAGACGVSGYVSEPYSYYTTRPEVLFDRYIKGYNVAESFYAACPELFWKSVVVGDPLMAPFATPPSVFILNSSETPITGLATLSVSAFDWSGVSKVEFYFDDRLIGIAAAKPYSITLDTTQYTVGPHLIEAIAYENSKVATQGHASAVLTIENPTSNLTNIADAFHSPDGQGVRSTGRVVTAATLDMGGKEFYIEDPSRTSGIKVVSNVKVAEGDLVTVVGDLRTDSGERSIVAATVSVTGRASAPVAPLGMPNKYVGGADLLPQTLGVTGGIGPRNLGLLVRTWGRVTHVGGPQEDFFYIDDGSNLDDGSGHIGLKVRCGNLSKPQFGSKVIVTGLSSCEKVGGRTNPVLKLRRQSDLLSLGI